MKVKLMITWIRSMVFAIIACLTCTAIGRAESPEEKKSTDLVQLSRSPAFARPIDRFFVRLFGEDDLTPEHLDVNNNGIEQWPSLVARLKSIAKKDLITKINAKGQELASLGKVTVKDIYFQGRYIVIVTAEIALKHGDGVYQVQQLFHFEFSKKGQLTEATWGLRSIREVHLKAPNLGTSTP